MTKKVIQTALAPKAIGPYSQAIQAGNVVYLSGQIPLNPETMALDIADFESAANRVFMNLEAVCRAAGGMLSNVVKLTIYLTDLANFATVNDVMVRYFKEPYPARSTIQVAALPKGVAIEIDAIMVLGD